MADYWKSTPKYWCKHCSAYVVDTKFGRANHEATGKHQSAVQRALRDLHREHDKQEREKEFARREIDRLNGVVGGSGSGSSSRNGRPPFRTPASQPPATRGPQTHLEQLADLGVSIPDQLRGDMAMAGEWTVTATRVVQDGRSGRVDARAVGVRKRRRGAGGAGGEGEEDDEDDEDGGDGGGGSGGLGGHRDPYKRVGSRNGDGNGDGDGDGGDNNVDAAVQGLFKRSRQWGRDSRTMAAVAAVAGEEGGDLDSLLTSALARPAKKIKKEEGDEPVKQETGEEETQAVKKEEDGAESAAIPAATSWIIREEGTGGGEEDAPVPEREVPVKTKEPSAGAAPPAAAAAPVEAVLFKKRKAKSGRPK